MPPPPQVMDAAALLGLDTGADSHDDDLLDDEDGEVMIACNNTGSDDDRAFDSVIGCIEAIMVSDAFDALRRDAVSRAGDVAALNDHERHDVFRGFLRAAEEFVDAEVTRALPDKPLADIAALISARKEEVSDEVIELVSGACMSYQQFLALWKQKQAATSSPDPAPAQGGAHVATSPMRDGRPVVMEDE